MCPKGKLLSNAQSVPASAFTYIPFQNRHLRNKLPPIHGVLTNAAVQSKWLSILSGTCPTALSTKLLLSLSSPFPALISAPTSKIHG